MGYAPTVSAVVSDHSLEDSDDDQLYYTKIFLDETKRVSWRRLSLLYTVCQYLPLFSQAQYAMRLDHRSHIFQNLNGAQDEVEIVIKHDHTSATNTLYSTNAAIYHGNGPSKVC